MVTLSKTTACALWAGVSVGLTGLGSARLGAGVVHFTVDSSRSRLAAVGTVVGATLQEQGPGSLSTSFSGQISADVTSSTIQFLDGSTILALTNGVWQPGPAGPSAAPADYAAQANVLGLVVKAAVRNLVLDLTSRPLPMVNGGFDASALLLRFPTNSSASFDYAAGALGQGSIALSGLATNRVVNGGILSSGTNLPSLSIQIDAQFYFKALTPNDSTVRVTGMLVAAPALEIRSIQLQGQMVTVEAQSAGGTANLQVSNDLKAWTSQAAGRTNVNETVQFTFQRAGDRGFYRLQE
jgi:hypothetical protein